MAKKFVFNERTGEFEEKEVLPIGKIAGGLLLSVGIAVLLFLLVRYLRGETYDFPLKNSSMYVMAEGLNLRQGGGTHNKILATAVYGEKVKILDTDETIWAKVDYKGQEGYMSLKGLLDIGDFEKLEKVWGDSDIRNKVCSLVDRKALVSYISQYSPDERYKLYYKTKRNRYFWSGKVSGRHVFAFVLLDRTTYQGCSAIYSFIDDSPKCEKTDMNITQVRYIKSVRYQNGSYIINYR